MAKKAPPARSLPPLLVALKLITEGTAPYTGERFFRSLVQKLAEVLGVHGVWVTRFREQEYMFDSIAFWLDGRMVEEYKYTITGTPCEQVLQNSEVVHFPDRVIQLFPKDPDLPPLGAVSYMGMALRDADGQLLGHLALLDNKPMPELPEFHHVFRIFASRAAAELQRGRQEQRGNELSAKLERLVNGSHEAMLEVDADHHLTQVNRAALTHFHFGSEQEALGAPLHYLFSADAMREVEGAMQVLARDGSAHVAVRTRLTCLRRDGGTFNGEATVGRYTVDGRIFHALYVRNVDEQLHQQRQLKALSTETAMLRERLAARDMEHIVGNSPGIVQCLEQVRQVAPTTSTVLITGETGTGKELIAQAVHQASRRADKPLVTLNCAALPAELIESELFGHVKGAFTGALTAREGRFTLADGGTLFLDELGELPLPLQAKLLRVLQQGQFEALGSSRTQQVDVRVIAATNRDLLEEVQAGRFREDLYYRLNVFPIAVPPLRDRGDDVLLIAEAMLEKFARRHHRPKPAIGEAEQRMLLKYPWPGNVRELQNVLERAIIAAPGGRLELRGMLPGTRGGRKEAPQEERILTEAEMNAIWDANIRRALEACGGRVAGRDGAAELLGIPPTTLSSRIRKLGIG